MDESVFHDLSYGMYIVSTKNGARSTGCIVNSVIQVTSQPAKIAVSVNVDNFTNLCIKESGIFAVSVLTESTNKMTIGTFGFKSGRSIDKFADIDYTLHDEIAIPTTACSYIICRLIGTLDAGTHTVFLGEVVECERQNSDPPMTYNYYYRVIKGKSPKNAPTYISDEKPVAPVYKCTLCGYEYNGDIPFEDLPDSYICPICGAHKSLFKLK